MAVFSSLAVPFFSEIPGKEIVNQLIAEKIAIDERPDGPVIVKLDELLGLKKEKYRVLVILRSDNTALYSTEDLALARIKFIEYPDLERSVYVVDVRQALHFQQVFKTLELAGYSWADKCHHIAYELVNLPGNVVMASREGTVVLLEDLLREARSRALAVVEEKNPDLETSLKEEIAEIRHKEAQNAADVIGAQLIWMNFDDEFLVDTPESRLKFIDTVRIAKPDIIFAHEPYNDYNPDHDISGYLAFIARINAAIKLIETDNPPIPKVPALFYYSTL